MAANCIGGRAKNPKLLHVDPLTVGIKHSDLGLETGQVAEFTLAHFEAVDAVTCC